MNTNSSLKEYYIKLNGMMNNAVNMLTAINQSLTTSASEITVTVMDTDNAETTVRIPSFLYLENKIEQLDSNFDALFNMPASGEAWFNKTSDMFKLQMVKSGTAPITPIVSTKNIGFSYKENSFLKDLVNPKTYVRLNIENLPDNIDKIFMRKMVIFDTTTVPYLQDLKTYEEYIAALYDKSQGVDYEIYDSEISLPVKKDTFKSSFRIDEIVEQEGGNPWYDISNSNHLLYKLRLNTIKYTDQEDSSIEFSLKPGDLVCLPNKYAIYKVKNVQNIYNMDNLDDNNDHIVILEEYLGHVALQTYEENSDMVFELYNEDYSKYHYVDIPLEENPYIVIFFATIQNNVRSILSDAIFLNLNNIYLVDENGNYIKDNSGNNISYMEYYEKYCKNIGDMILGITESAYPQISNYTNNDLNRMTASAEMRNIVTQSLYKENNSVLTVTKINSHLIDDVTSENIMSLHEQKSEINAQLNTVQANIDNVYNQLTTTDFSQEVSITQESLRSQLNTYYQERLTLQKQAISIIDNINLLKGDVNGLGKSKFRVRGVTDACDINDSDINSPFIEYLHAQFGQKCDVIGMEVEYKYKSINKDTTTIESNTNSLFTDWNKMPIVERQRYLDFDADGNYTIKFVKYNSANNIIKWNQIDIPINSGEDVVLRIRYIYSIGQPFINLYTPWSEETTVSFPVDMIETTEMSTVLEDNEIDTISAKFTKTLINEGYQEHISNMIIDNSQTFYHMPENIYSGFNTTENKLISLKDKLTSMVNDIDNYKSLIENELNAKYEVYLEFDNNTVLLTNNTENNILINEIMNGTNDSFIKKKMNIIIRNIGSTAIRLYSIFPGNTNVPLLKTDMEFYNKYVRDYERVPILKSGGATPRENIIWQTLGQWIYFRQNSPYTREDYYLNTSEQRNLDNVNAKENKDLTFVGNGSTLHQNYMSMDRKQALLGYRERTDNLLVSMTDEDIISKIDIDSIISKDPQSSEYITTLISNISNVLKSSLSLQYSNNIDYTNMDISNFVYDNVNENADSNLYVLKYEHIHGKDMTNQPVYMSEKNSITNFMNYSFDGWGFDKKTSFNGAFLIPEIISETMLTCDEMDTNQYKKLDVGKSLSIPVIFEYYLDGDELKNITKTLAFDIRSSLMQDPEHYVLNIKAIYDYSQTNADLAANISLLDSLTEK